MAVNVYPDPWNHSNAWEIKSGRVFQGLNPYDSARTVFGGIENEARIFPASWALSPQAPAAGFSNGFSYLILPPNVTTDLYFTIEIEEWWLKDTLGIYFEWVNLHSAGGDVRWDMEFRECQIGVHRLQDAFVTGPRSKTVPGVAAGFSTTTVAFSIADGFPAPLNPGPISSFWSLRISRMGGQAADTLEGNVGFISTNMTRNQ